MKNWVRSVSAVVLAALIAGAVTVLPSFSEQVDASAPIKAGAVVTIQPLAAKCAGQHWPYIEADCVRDGRKASGIARAVSRTVALDRIR